MTKIKKSPKTVALARVEPDYNERAALAERKAQAALFKQADQLWHGLQRERDSFTATAIATVNLAAQLGGVIVQICGREQVVFEFWKNYCAEQLPFNLEAAQELVSVFKKVPEPITDISQIWPVWKQVNLAMGTLTIPERAGEQSAAETTVCTLLTKSLNHSFALFEKWTQSEPLADWPASQLENLIMETKQIHDLHETALALLKRKAGK
jgi:hypothetical protein